MARINASEFLKDFRAARGEDALMDRPSIALAVRMAPGFDPEDPSSLYEPSMLVYPVVDPVLDALMIRAGATPRGSMSWQLGLGDNVDTASVSRLLNHAYPGTVMPENWAFTKSKARDLTTDISRSTWTWQRSVSQHPLVGHIFAAHANKHGSHIHPYQQDDTAPRYGVITFGLGHNSLWMKAFTYRLVLPQELIDEIGPVNLDLRPPARVRKDPKAIRPAAAVAICEWAKRIGMELVDADGSQSLGKMRNRLAHVTVAWTRPGRPAQAQVSVGTKVQLSAAADPEGTLVAAPRSEYHMPESGENLRVARASRIVQADAAQLATLRTADVEVVMHPAVADMASLAASTPIDDERLRPKQREAVGRHLATEVGYANLSDPGAGKTIMSLVGMQRRAAAVSAIPGHSGYRGLVIAEANVRKQFSDHAREWFDNAIVITVDTAAKAAQLESTLATAGNFPVVVITSYALASAVADVVEVTDLDAELAALFAEENAGEEEEGENQHLPLAVDEADLPEDAVLAAAAPEAAAQPETDPEISDPARVHEPAAVAVSATSSAWTEGQGSLFDLDGNIAVDLVEVPLADADPSSDEPPAACGLGEVLLSVFWDDIIADEAACLRNYGSKQSKALWALRKNAQVAVALTGTPISRSLDDLGKIVGWVRGDRHMFSGISLTNLFDFSEPDAQVEFTRAFGPVLFRMDKTDFSDELPPLAPPMVIKLQPSLAEKRLAYAARNELKRAYEELVALLEHLEATNPDDPEFAEVRSALTAAHGALLGGTQLARMAASDPAALLYSNTAGAALLAGQGLIEEATREPGTKRKALVELAVEKIAAGERILLFTEFASVARGLIEDLSSAGIRVGAILGGGGKKRDEDVEAFARGELDMIVSTSSGERGLNLQTATMLIHYDLPWTPSAVVQRTGRVERIGATAAQIQIVFLIMEETIEEKVVSLVAARAVEMMQAMDAARGEVGDRVSPFMQAFSGLISSANLNELSVKDASLVEITREVLGIGS